jgi:hypothetical protein
MKLTNAPADMRRFFPLTAWCLIGFSLHIASGDLRAQTGDIPTPRGTDIFRQLLHGFGVSPLKSLADIENEPEKKVLIVLGETDVLDRLPIKLRDFVRRGGAALIATDRRTTRDSPLGSFRISVDGRQVLAPPGEGYKELRECALIDFPNPGGSAFFRFRPDEGAVATNRPSFLIPRAQSLQIFAFLPFGCSLEKESGTLGRLPFAAAGEVGKGRILVLADHSVFINTMLWLEDTQNLDFADACLDWLVESKRTEAFFIEEGKIQTRFDLQLNDLPPPTLPPVEDILRSVNRGLEGLEDENRFNQIIANALEKIASMRFSRVLLLVLTVGLGLVGLSRLSLARHRTEPALPPLRNILTGQETSAPIVEQRAKAMARYGSYYEPARALARQFYESIGNFEFPSIGSNGDDGTEGPVLKPHGSLWQQFRTKSRLRRLWRLASGDEPVRVSRRQLLRLARDIDRLNADLASGCLVVIPNPQTGSPRSL